jgi:hypothetical protein
VGVYLETGQVDLVKMFTSPIYSNYSYTMLESVLDFDKFLAEFWFSVIFCLILIGYIVIYGKSHDEFQKGDGNKVLRRRSWTFGTLALGLFIFVIIGAMLKWGLYRSYMGDDPFTILADNLYPEYFSEQLYVIGLLAAGFGLIIYRTMRGFGDGKTWMPNLGGLKFLLLGFLIVEIFAFVFPIKSNLFFTGNTLLELLSIIFQTLLIVGIIGIVEWKEQFVSSIKKNERITENKENDMISESIVPGESSSRSKLKIHFFCFSIAVVFMIILGIIGFIVLEPSTDIGTFRSLQQTLIALFRIFFCLFLYSLEGHIQCAKKIEPDGTEGRN